ncbi:MAG: HAD family hydrolase [Anaerolineaceae bacterium]
MVFDFDGLILNTEEPEFNSWQKIYQQYGAYLELDEWLACVGASLEVFDPVQNLQARVSEPLDLHKVQRERRRLFDQYMADMPLQPGVQDYLREAKHLGLKLAVASSSGAKWVIPFLQQYRIHDLFDAVCVREDVENVKPDPALYLLAVERLGVASCESVAFEDSYNGLLAAKRAGLYCVAVPNIITQSLDFSAADQILASLSEISLPDLLGRIVKTGD